MSPAVIRFLLYSLACVMAFAFGRYTTTLKTETTAKQTEVVTHRTVITKKSPDGTVEVTESESSESRLQTIKSVDIKARPRINVSALAGIDTTNSMKTAYGLSINKEIFGPITVGAFGLSNGTVGLSVGMNF